FNIPGAGVHTINLASSLPNITDAVIIDGYTQAGARANTLTVGDNAVLQVEINNPGGFSNYTLVLDANGSTVRGLVLHAARFAAEILVRGTSDRIEGNFIGTNATGNAVL